MLTRLKSYDSVFLDGVTIAGDVKSSASSKPGRKVEFSADRSRCVLRETGLPPSYAAADTKVTFEADRTYDESGNLTLLMEDRVEHIFEPARCSRMNIYVEYVISPSGEVIRQSDKLQRVVIYPPQEIALLIPKVRILWTLGRGFGAFLDEVTSVETGEDGLLSIKAVGRTMSGASGTWTLSVDPAQADLVRSAKWSPRGESTPFLEIETAGTRLSGTLPHPESGTFKFDMSGTPVTYSVSFSGVSQKFDSEFYAAIDKRLSGDYAPNTNVHDRRTTPETYYFVNPKGKTGPSRPESVPPSTAALGGGNRRRWIVWGNLSILAVFGTLYWLRRLWTASRENGRVP